FLAPQPRHARWCGRAAEYRSDGREQTGEMVADPTMGCAGGAGSWRSGYRLPPLERPRHEPKRRIQLRRGGMVLGLGGVALSPPTRRSGAAFRHIPEERRDAGEPRAWSVLAGPSGR